MAEDRYSAWLGASVTESAAGTISFQSILTSVGFGSGKGMLIDEIDYFLPQATIDLFLAQPDRVEMGITTSTGVTDLADVTDSRIIHSSVFALELLSGVGFSWYRMPLVYQFFPALVHAHREIQLAVQGISMAASVTARARIYWRFLDLTDRNIAELVQAHLIQA